MDFTKLETLESRVSAMLDKVASLVNQNERLETDLLETQETLSDTKTELETTQALVAKLQAEREAILAKVDQILERLE